MLNNGQAINATILGVSSLLIAFGLVVNVRATADYYLQSPLLVIELAIGAMLLVFGVAGISLASR